MFISYSRKGGTEFAAQLRADLSARSLSVGQDIASMEGGREGSGWAVVRASGDPMIPMLTGVVSLDPSLNRRSNLCDFLYRVD